MPVYPVAPVISAGPQRGRDFPAGGEREGETSLYRLTRQYNIVDMISTATKIRRIRDKLSRIGIGEKKLDDAAILALYSLNGVGNLCPVPRTP
jgi:hypothetical protein